MLSIPSLVCAVSLQSNRDWMFLWYHGKLVKIKEKTVIYDLDLPWNPMNINRLLPVSRAESGAPSETVKLGDLCIAVDLID